MILIQYKLIDHVRQFSNIVVMYSLDVSISKSPIKISFGLVDITSKHTFDRYSYDAHYSLYLTKYLYAVHYHIHKKKRKKNIDTLSY
jgi:hypothetical protein